MIFHRYKDEEINSLLGDESCRNSLCDWKVHAGNMFRNGTPTKTWNYTAYWKKNGNSQRTNRCNGRFQTASLCLNVYKPWFYRRFDWYMQSRKHWKLRLRPSNLFSLAERDGFAVLISPLLIFIKKIADTTYCGPLFILLVASPRGFEPLFPV